MDKNCKHIKELFASLQKDLQEFELEYLRTDKREQVSVQLQERKNAFEQKKETLCDLIDFDRKSFRYLEILFDGHVPNGFMPHILAGNDSKWAWNKRNDLLKKGMNIQELLPSLLGLDSKESWKFRDQVQEKDRDGAFFLSLCGVDSERAWLLREQAGARGGKFINFVAKSLAGLETQQAWEMRERIVAFKGHKTSAYTSGLAGCLGRRAQDERWEVTQAESAFHQDVLLSLVGLSGDDDWFLRTDIESKSGRSVPFFESMAGDDSEKAWSVREQIMKAQPLFLDRLALTLAGLNSKRAWEMRERLKTMGANRMYLARSVAGSEDSVFLKLTEKRRKQFHERV